MSRRILIVDDERLARLRIKNYLSARHPDFVVCEAADGYEALDLIPTFQPEILFLDIEMPELSGFDLLQQLDKTPFQIIFQTAYDQFAVKAFEVNACDYLLKPFPDLRLNEALGRATRRDAGEFQLTQLEKHFRKHGRFLDRIVVKIGNRSKLIEVDSIKYISSEDHCTRIFLDKMDYAYDRSLGFLEERLDPSRFVRIHRNCIVSLSEVATFGQKTQMKLTLKSGEVLSVARNRTSPLLDALKE